MHRVARILVITGGVLVVAVGVAVLVLFVVSEERLNRVYAVEPDPVTIPAERESIAVGESLAQAMCAECHGQNLGGGETFSHPDLGEITAGNLTSGEGGIGQAYTDQDWVRAIRYGVGPDGKGLILMPSERFYSLLNDRELGALIAYLKSLPPVDNQSPAPSLSLPGRLNYVTGTGPTLLAVELIDLDARPSAVVGAPIEIADVLFTCTGCHGADLAGGGDDSLDITSNPETGIGGWTMDDFARLMREDIRPNGSPTGLATSHQQMTGELSDEQISLLWEFLQSLPADGGSD